MSLTEVTIHNESHLFYDGMFIVGYIPSGYSGSYGRYYGRIVPDLVQGINL